MRLVVIEREREGERKKERENERRMKESLCRYLQYWITNSQYKFTLMSINQSTF